MTQEENKNFLIHKDEINRRCCEVIYKNVTFLRDNWVKEMEACNWGARMNEIDSQEETMMREVCDFIIFEHLVLVDMLIESNVDFTTFNYAVKKSITIGNSTIPQNSNVTLRATDFIQLNGGFTLPLGSELNIVPTPCF